MMTNFSFRKASKLIILKLLRSFLIKEQDIVNFYENVALNFEFFSPLKHCLTLQNLVSAFCFEYTSRSGISYNVILAVSFKYY